ARRKAHSPPPFADPGETVPPPRADGQSALAEMETALDATLAALDRYQREWARLLTEPPPATAEADERLARLEGRLREWDARLAAAAELAGSVGGELHGRGNAGGRLPGV